MSHDPITFRRLRPEDDAIFEHVADETFDHAVSHKHLAPFLADPGHEMIVALAGDLVVGLASGVVIYHPDKAPQFWVNEVGTGVDWRRRGIGGALIKAMQGVAKLRGCGSVWLLTEEDNAPARALYEKEGARQTLGVVMLDWDL